MLDPSPSGSSAGSTSSGLLRQVQARDPDAWRRLVRLYGPLVGHWIGRAGLQAADAEDVFQAVFQAVAGHLAGFRKDQPGDSFRGWLRTITRSKLADLHRQRAAEPRAVGGSDALRQLTQLPEADLSRSDATTEPSESQVWRRRVLELVRGEFEPRTWEAFWRVTVEGDSVTDVAAELGVTAGAVRMAKSRVLRRLREAMQGLNL